MTVTPETMMRAQAKVLRGQAGESNEPQRVGFSSVGEHGASSVVWTATVTLPQWTGVKFRLDTGAYTKAGSPTVTDGLLNGTDLGGNALSMAAVYSFGVRFVGHEAYSGTAGYSLYFGRYTGPVADWQPNSSHTAANEDQMLTPKGAIVRNLGWGGVALQNWILYNISGGTYTAEIFVSGMA